MFVRARKRTSKLAQRVHYCIWFVLFLAIAGLSLFYVSKHVPGDVKDRFFHLKGSIDPHSTAAVIELPLVIPPIMPPATAKPVAKVYHGYPVVSRPSFDELHFIHIPKCGGTTMTAVLRQLMCNLDTVKNADCCLNPGFCDWHTFRRCANIKGCINHFPNRKLIFKALPSMAVFREPTSRLISAFFYRGHSPNNDFFQVRPEFKLISQGKAPKVSFQEYIEMPEYQNIFTRMLGADSFPYRNVTVTDEVYAQAVDAVNHIYFIGLQEDFDISVQAITRMMDITASNITVTKERGGESKSTTDKKHELKANQQLMARVREVNRYDIELYKLVVQRYCSIIAQFPDLLEVVKRQGRIPCA